MAARKLELSAATFIPENLTLSSLQEAAGQCRGCDLYLRATQTVFGEGSVGARILLVGEQPGDKEDLKGKPFVGPAGKLLNRALEDAGIARADAYVTNAVKHFKWEARGKRRIHEKPTATEVAACRPWLDAEVKVVRPRVVVCLGASAAQSLLGRDFKVTQRRGERIDGRSVAHSLNAWIVATVHPSSILRAQDGDARHREYALFVNDLRSVADLLKHDLNITVRRKEKAERPTV